MKNGRAETIWESLIFCSCQLSWKGLNQNIDCKRALVIDYLCFPFLGVSLDVAVFENEEYLQAWICFSLLFFRAAFGVAKSATALMAQKAPEVASKNLMATLAGAVPVLLASTAAVATEGTGEWFGVDDTRLLLVLFIGHWFILTLWFQQYGKYDESEDFFGEIDYTTSKK